MKNSLYLLIIVNLLCADIKAQSLEEAKKLTENEQYDVATSLYQNLISKNPADGNAYYFYGENLLLGDNPDSASIVFDQGLKTDPNNLLLKIGKAKLLLDGISLREAQLASDKDPSNAELKARYTQAQNDVNSAGTLLNEVVNSSISSKNAIVLIEAADALIHFKNKNLDKAKEYLDRAGKIEPKNPEVNILYGDIYTEKNDGTLAADYYNRALDLDKSSARAIVSKGRLYKRSTNYEGAAEEFKNAIQVNPSYAPAYRELAETYIKLGRLLPAKENYVKYLDLTNKNCTARIRYASLLYLGKEYKDAIQELDQAKQRCDSGGITLLRVYTYCYYETKEYDKGLEKVQELFRRLPLDKRAAIDYEYYGKLLVENNQDSSGIIQLRKAYETDPSRTDLLSDIAATYFKLKNYTAAIGVWNEKRSTGVDMKSSDYYYLGRAYYFTRQFEQADSAFMKVNELTPSYVSGWLWRAQSNTQMDSTSDLGLAKPFYLKYLEVVGDDTTSINRYRQGVREAYSYLASYAFLKEKDHERAVYYLRKKLDLTDDPDEKKAIEQQIDQILSKKSSGR